MGTIEPLVFSRVAASNFQALGSWGIQLRDPFGVPLDRIDIARFFKK